jgi:hypothetical protein
LPEFTHRSFIAFIANDVWRRHYELSKQLKYLLTDVALLSETLLKAHEGFFVPNYHFYETDCFPGRKGIPHNRADLHVCYMFDKYTCQMPKPLRKRHTHPVVRECVT